MATLDEAEADTLREKLGGRRIGTFEEQRVVSKGGAVIRRRKKVVPDPVPEPEPVPELTPVPVPEPLPEPLAALRDAVGPARCLGAS